MTNDEVDEHVREVELAVEERTGPEAVRIPADDYRRAMEALSTVGTDEDVEKLATWIVDLVAESGEPPQAAAVRSEARDVCDRRGYEVPSDSWLAES